jgi:putative ABC transport system permease protein
MNISQLCIESLTSLSAHRLRTALSMLGVVIGIMAVTLMMALGSSIQGFVSKQLEMLGKNILLVAPNTEKISNNSHASIPELSIADIEPLRSSPVIAGIAPVIQTNVIASNSANSIKATVLGSDETMLTLRGWRLASGSSISSDDVKKHARVVVIGKKLSESLFFLQNPIYKYIRIDGIPFQVVGVLETEGKSFDGTDLGSLALIPHTTVAVFLLNMRRPDIIHYAVVQARSSEQLTIAKESIDFILKEKHGSNKFGESSFQITDLASVAKGASLITSALAFMLGAISIVSLGVGGIGIMNIMLVSVTERTKEIGIRLALGAKRSDIRAQFLFESIVICLIGAAIGILLSFGIAILVSSVSKYPLSIGTGAITLSVSFAFCVGVFFGYFPARRAAQLLPAESLRV